MDFSITMLPISAGDATLLSAGTTHILIDTGLKRDEVADYLKQIKIDHLPWDLSRPPLAKDIFHLPRQDAQKWLLARLVAHF